VGNSDQFAIPLARGHMFVFVTQLDLGLPCTKMKAVVWCRVMVGLIRPLNESDQKKFYLSVLCVPERPTGAGERKSKLAFLHSTAWTISKADGLWF